jgi:hypothetical protein
MENIVQLFKFATVGCFNTLIDWAIYFIILKLFPAESVIFYTAAKGFSYFCGILNSFFLNRVWTFRDSLQENEVHGCKPDRPGHQQRFGIHIPEYGVQARSGPVFCHCHNIFLQFHFEQIVGFSQGQDVCQDNRGLNDYFRRSQKGQLSLFPQ